MILCVGTTPVMQRTMVFNALEIDAVNRAVEVHETASGKSINVARVAHRLGEPVLATGFVGGDSGRFIRADLAACAVAQCFVDVDAKTRMCVTVLDQSTGEATELVEESKSVAAQSFIDLQDVIEQNLPRAKVLVLSGSLTPGAPQDFYAWCTRRAGDFNVKTIVDASGEPLRQALAAKPFLVKPNRSELEKTLNVTIDSDETLKSAIARLGVPLTIITEGKSGAVLSDGRSFWRLRAPQVNAMNPIGSGDSLAAGVAVGIARGMSIPDAAKLGIACGAANAETLTAGVVDAARVAALVEAVRIETM